MTLHFTARQKLSFALSTDPVTPVSAEASAARQETADDYDHVLFLSADKRLRVIVCRDARQWIAQTRRAFTSKSLRPWSARGFCVSKVGLRRSLGAARIAEITGLAEFLATLPAQFPREAR